MRRDRAGVTVLGVGDLEVRRPGRHRHDRDVRPVVLQAGRRVGAVEAVAARGPVGREQRPGAERLRCLDADQRRRPAAGRAGRAAAGRSARTVGTAPPASRAAATTCSNRLAGASGRAPSWTTTTSTSPASIRAASTSSAACSESCRVAPPGTSSTSRSPRWGPTAAVTSSSSPGRQTRTTGSTSGRPSTVSTEWASTGVPSRGSSTLLTSAPTREPLPAARITTAADMAERSGRGRRRDADQPERVRSASELQPAQSSFLAVTRRNAGVNRATYGRPMAAMTARPTSGSRCAGSSSWRSIAA